MWFSWLISDSYSIYSSKIVVCKVCTRSRVCHFISKLSTYISFQAYSLVLCQRPRLAILCLLRAKLGDFAAHYAMKCSSFCAMNRGTSKRTACSSTGFTEYASVRVSNMLGERRRVKRFSRGVTSFHPSNHNPHQ